MPITASSSNFLFLSHVRFDGGKSTRIRTFISIATHLISRSKRPVSRFCVHGEHWKFLKCSYDFDPTISKKVSLSKTLCFRFWKISI